MTIKPECAYRRFLELLRRLDEAKIAFTLGHHRVDAVTVEATVPGERWEIEFVDYGDEVQVEVERFRSNGSIDDESLLETLFARYSAESPEMSAEEDRAYDDAFHHR